MTYVDFYCIPLPEDKEAEYTKMAELFGNVLKDYGLLSSCEAIADDVARGEQTDFYRAVAAKDGETVVTTYMVWPDKATRDEAWEKSMKDPRLAHMAPGADMPFDGKRMFWGGFRPIVTI